MSSTSPALVSPWPQFALGMRMFAPVAVSIFAYGLVWGVLAGEAGLTPLEVLLMSSLVFTGSGQFVVLQLWMPSALPIGTMLLAIGIVSLRLALMSATLRPLLREVPRWRAALMMFLIADEQWALTMGEVGKGRGSAAFFVGAGTLSWLAWVASTIAGRLLGSVITDPTAYGLDFAFTATFLALLLGMWKRRSDLIPWLAGALIAVVVARLVPGQWFIIAGGLGGSLAGALAEQWRTRHVG